jgi:hypothetical protein
VRLRSKPRGAHCNLGSAQQHRHNTTGFVQQLALMMVGFEQFSGRIGPALRLVLCMAGRDHP